MILNIMSYLRSYFIKYIYLPLHQRYQIDTFINDIYNVIDKNYDTGDFIEQILCNYDKSKWFNGFIEKFIETKNIPTRRHLLLALQTNCYDIVRSFISAGGKLDKNIFDDLPIKENTVRLLIYIKELFNYINITIEVFIKIYYPPHKKLLHINQYNQLLQRNFLT